MQACAVHPILGACPMHPKEACPVHPTEAACPVHPIDAYPVHPVEASPVHPTEACPVHPLEACPVHLLKASPVHPIEACPVYPMGREGRVKIIFWALRAGGPVHGPRSSCLRMGGLWIKAQSTSDDSLRAGRREGVVADNEIPATPRCHSGSAGMH